MAYILAQAVRGNAVCTLCGLEIYGCDKCANHFSNTERIFCNRSRHLCLNCFKPRVREVVDVEVPDTVEVKRICEAFMEDCEKK